MAPLFGGVSSWKTVTCAPQSAIPVPAALTNVRQYRWAAYVIADAVRIDNATNPVGAGNSPPLASKSDEMPALPKPIEMTDLPPPDIGRGTARWRMEIWFYRPVIRREKRPVDSVPPRCTRI